MGITCNGVSASGVITHQKEGRSIKTGKKEIPEPGSVGSYYALIIGNDEYLHIPKLQTAVNDAKAVSEVLQNRYGFETNLLLNASRDQIIKAINQYRHNLDENTNLLI